jgi:uracil-DNA glycosylase
VTAGAAAGAGDRAAGLAALDAEVVSCRRCPRLVDWRERVAAE